MSKKAILMVSFGTTHLDTLDKTIGAIERAVGERFPDYKLYRAFTSHMVIKKLKQTKNMEVATVREAFEQMISDHVTEVIVQPTHIINGIENDQMLADIRVYEEEFDEIRIGRPLLSESQDYKKVVETVTREFVLEKDEMLILMGHGTDHHANSAYPALEYTFDLMGYHNVLVGTVEGFPDLQDIMKKINRSNCKKVVLAPLLIVAGDHAKNDMAGSEDSWKTNLEEAGYEVRVILQGLGELRGIRELFVEHIEEA